MLPRWSASRSGVIGLTQCSILTWQMGCMRVPRTRGDEPSDQITVSPPCEVVMQDFHAKILASNLTAALALAG